MKVTDEQLVAAVLSCRNMRELLAAVGLVPSGANYESVRGRLTRLGLLDQRFEKRTRSYHHEVRRTLDALSQAELEQAVAAARTVTQLVRGLGLRPDGYAHRNARRLVEARGADTSHWTPRSSTQRSRRVPLDRVLVKGRLVQGTYLARRLIQEQVVLDCCACCGGSSWMGGAMPLELDHVNGDRLDNRRENLRLLCPNCHALTGTYRGRNIGRTA